jgi:hypothetical protein
MIFHAKDKQHIQIANDELHPRASDKLPYKHVEPPPLYCGGYTLREALL